MTARVMLFADFGKGHPIFGKGIQRVRCSDPVLGGTIARAAKAQACRWWLVECETAARGRLLIAASLDGGDPIELYEGGRILDSGVNGGAS